jgi:bifunctional non-homologous end joining protein LigD
MSAGDGWIHEPKLEGYRLKVVKDGPTVCLYSRRGHDWGEAPRGPGRAARRL